jgi:predicted porin
MMSIGATYNVNDDFSVNASQTTYGENGFGGAGANMGVGTGSWTSHGNMGFLRADDKNLSVGATYSMGDFNLGATMHMVSNDEATGNYTDGTSYDRSVTELNLGYTMSDNASVGLQYANDKGAVTADDDDKYMWITLCLSNC